MSETKQTETFKSSSSSSVKKKPSAPSDSPPPSRSPSPASSPSSSPCPSPTPDRKDENWVQCDLCQKWRRLPLNVDTSRLPERWFCDMNRWDSARNSCAAPEEGTEPPPPVSSIPITNVVWSGMPKCFIATEDRQRFFSILIKFLQSSGQFHRLGRFPNVGKKPLDLYVLYLGVIRMGGMDQIIEKTGWRPISELFNFPPTTTSSGNSLMKNYRKYLYTFEKRYMPDHTVPSHHWGHGSLTNLRAANWNNDTTYEQMTDHHSKSSPHTAAARQRRKMRKAVEEAAEEAELDGEDGIDILSQVISADTTLTRGVSNNSTTSSRHGGSRKRHQNPAGLRVRTDLSHSAAADPELSPDSSLATFDSADEGDGRDYTGEDAEDAGADAADEELEPVPLKRSKSNDALPVSRSRMMHGVRGRHLSRETSEHSHQDRDNVEEDKEEEHEAAYYDDDADVDMTARRHASLHTLEDSESFNAEDADEAQLPRYHSSLTIEVTEAAARTPTGLSHSLLHSRDKTERPSLTGRDSSGWPLAVLPLSSSFSVASAAAATLATSSRILHQPSPSHSLSRHMIGMRPMLTPSPPSSPGGLPAQWSPDSIGSTVSSSSAHPRDSLMDPIHLSGTRICSLEELLQRLDDRIRCEDEMLKRVDQISAVLQKRIQGVRERAKAFRLEDASDSTHSPRSVDF